MFIVGNVILTLRTSQRTATKYYYYLLKYKEAGHPESVQHEKNLKQIQA